MAEEDSTYGVLDLVVVQNLQKAAEYNGRVCIVKELLTERARITVKVAETDKLLNVKTENLRDPTEAELKEQLPVAFDKLRKDQIEVILANSDVAFASDASKEKLIELAVQAKLAPEPVKKRVNLDEEVEVPGGGRMTRGEMLERAKQLESMTPAQMREQLRVLTSRSPQELRTTVPQTRQMTDAQIQAQIEQLQTFLNNPKLRRLQIEAMKTGDFSKLNNSALASMTPREIRENARKQLEAFRKDPVAFRQQFFADQASLSDQDIQDMLEMQINADDDMIRAMSGGSKKMGDIDISSMSEDQYKKNAELQLKMFKANPKKVREQLEKQNPEVKNMSDEQLVGQLETMATMSKKDIEDMAKYAKAMQAPGGAGPQAGGAPNLAMMENMSGDQLRAVFRTQRDMFKRDPKGFRKMVPQMAALSDEQIQSQLDMMADMDPSYIKMFISVQQRFGNVFARIQGPLDSISGGRGQQIIGVVMLIVGLLVVYFLGLLLYRLLGLMMPTTFGYSSQSAPQTQGSSYASESAQAAPGAGVQVEVDVDDDAFFQEDL